MEVIASLGSMFSYVMSLGTSLESGESLSEKGGVIQDPFTISGRRLYLLP